MKVRILEADRAAENEEEDEFLLNFLGGILETESRRSRKYGFVPNKEREEEVRTVFRIFQEILEGESLRVSCKLHGEQPDFGTVSVVGRSITIHDTAAFARALSLSDNLDVYPKTDGTLCFDVGFYGLKER